MVALVVFHGRDYEVAGAASVVTPDDGWLRNEYRMCTAEEQKWDVTGVN